MLGHEYYHATLRRYVILFGTLFNDVVVNRRDSSGNVVQTIQVPLTYAPKEKMTARLEGNLNLDNQEAMLLPRISFEMTSMNYDGERKLNTLNRYTARDQNDPARKLSTFNPVPYNINFELNVYVKYAEDATAILEQILPFFTPEWTSTIELIPEMAIKMDIPVVLQGLSSQDTYEGDFDTRRALIWNLQFLMKGYLFGPVTKSKIIKTSNVSIHSTSNTLSVTPAVGIIQTPGLTSDGQPTSNASISISTSSISSNDNYGVITNFEDYFNGETN
jgi:hypothetical protein